MSIETLVLAAAVAVASWLIGCFAVMRRMTLAADALSHVALPGIGVALALHVNPLAGAGTYRAFEPYTARNCVKDPPSWKPSGVVTVCCAVESGQIDAPTHHTLPPTTPT